jgi:monoamine oxidase
MAAWELAAAGKKTAIIEASNHMGGRIQTIHDPGFSLPVEAGAEFVHGDLELTQLLLKKAALDEKKIKGSLWQKKDGKFCEQEDFIEDYELLERKFKELKEDISVQEFFEHYLNEDKFEQVRYTLKNYVEGYYAGSISNASAMALCKELTESSDSQYRIAGGYQQLVDFLARDCSNKGCMFFHGSPVESVNWDNEIIVTTSDGKQYQAEKMIITVSLGVLRSQSINFHPAIEEKINLANKLGFGPVIKILLEFRSSFWKSKELTQNKDLSDLTFLFTSEDVPVWWTQEPDPAPILVGWLGGPNAAALSKLSNEEIVQAALHSLSNIFNIEDSYLQTELKGSYVKNWIHDALFMGGYSYEVVNGSDLIKRFSLPIQNRIYFAGEGVFDGAEIGTVEGALQTGRDTARQVISSFKMV